MLLVVKYGPDTLIAAVEAIHCCGFGVVLELLRAAPLLLLVVLSCEAGMPAVLVLGLLLLDAGGF